jgi:hypothetical protein
MLEADKVKFRPLLQEEKGYILIYFYICSITLESEFP